MRSTSRCADYWACLTLLAPPDPASSSLDRARVVSLAGAVFVLLSTFANVCYWYVYSSIGPPTRNSSVEWASDYYLWIKARWSSYTTFFIHRRYWNVFFLYGFSIFPINAGYSERVTLASNSRWQCVLGVAHDDRNLQPPATSYQALITWKRNTMYAHSQSRHLCALHLRRLSTRSAPSYLRVATELNNTYSP